MGAAATRLPTLLSLAAFALFAAPAVAQVEIDIAEVIAGVASSVTVEVRLDSKGASVGGTQNDLLFDTRVVRLASVTGCRIHPEIGTNRPGCDADPIVGPCKTLSRNLVNCSNSPTAPGCGD